jgi:hypothetical protein
MGKRLFNLHPSLKTKINTIAFTTIRLINLKSGGMSKAHFNL